MVRAIGLCFCWMARLARYARTRGEGASEDLLDHESAISFHST